MGDEQGKGKDPRPAVPAGVETLRPYHSALQSADLLSAIAQRRLEEQKGSLVVIAGTPADIGAHLRIADRVVIGREQGGLKLRDGLLSRNHALVTRGEDGYWVEDMGSTNGTMLNGVALTERRKLSPEDRITLGKTVIKFTIIDATEASYLDEMARMSSTDSLTGLVAKHRFDAALEEAFRVARIRQDPLSALMMDMDGLKAVNDRLGHHVGAGTISKVGVLISQIVGDRGEACRFGGDEFAAFLPAMPLEAAREVAEKIRFAVEDTTFEIGALKVNVHISVGIAELDAQIATSAELLNRSDQALYRAKEKGRNQVSD
jgi:two-component system, cell cycle response regulator